MSFPIAKGKEDASFWVLICVVAGVIFCGFYIYKLRADNSVLRSKELSWNERMDKKDAEMEKLEAKIDNLFEKDERNDVLQRLDQEKSTCRRNINNLQYENYDLRTREKNCNAMNSVLLKEKAACNKNIKDLKMENSDLWSKEQRCRASNSLTESEKNQCLHQVLKLEVVVDKKDAKVEKLEAKITNMRSKRNDVLQRLDLEKTACNKKITDLKKENADLWSKEQICRASNLPAESEKKQRLDKVVKLERDKNDAKMENLEAKFDNLKDSVNSQRSDHEKSTCQKSIKDLQTVNFDLRN
jgi:hypothetical protein